MEDNQYIAGEQHKERSLKETFRSGSADEVREKVKETVEKGIAAFSGALKGFADSTEKSHVAETTRSAIHQAGETARATVSSVTEEAKGLKGPLKDASQKLRDTGRELRDDVRSQWKDTKDAVKDPSSSSSMGMGGSSLGSSSLGAGSFGAGAGAGSTLGSGSGLGETDTNFGAGETGAGKEFPDIRDTPMAKSDKALQGKDISTEYEEE